jgi:hypothetical protein
MSADSGHDPIAVGKVLVAVLAKHTFEALLLVRS